jgi:hypothetical protein
MLARDLPSCPLVPEARSGPTVNTILLFQLALTIMTFVNFLRLAKKYTRSYYIFSYSLPSDVAPLQVTKEPQRHLGIWMSLNSVPWLNMRTRIPAGRHAPFVVGINNAL